MPIVGIVELSGACATAGTHFDNGVKLAVKEVNAAGGIAGRKIDCASWDTQTQPGVAKALATEAVDRGAPLVMGPVFSGSIPVSVNEAKRAEIPNIIGGEAAAITQQSNPFVFRCSFTQAAAMPKVVRYIEDSLKAKTVAVMYVNNDFGKGGRDMIVKSLEADGGGRHLDRQSFFVKVVNGKPQVVETLEPTKAADVADAAERMLASDDALEGPRAFAEKRQPSLMGR